MNEQQHEGHGAGGHLLPLQFAQDFPPAPSKKRHRALPVSLAAAALICIASALHIGVNVAYDDAESTLDLAAETLSLQQQGLATAMAEVGEVQLDIDGVIAADSGRFLPPELRMSLESDSAVTAEIAADSEEILNTGVPHPQEKPIMPWDLLSETAEMSARTDSALVAADAADALVDVASAHEAALSSTMTDALTQAADAAPQFEAAHVSARNLDIVALREAASQLRDEAENPSGNADTLFAALESTANQVLASEQAEMAEKTGPLMQTRIEIEAYARSLAPGVLLDFDWATLVNGTGLNGSLSGRATWWYQSGGYSTIELSNSVAEQWPADRSKALVAHEVGHSISVRCEGMYDTSTAENIEAWATAWAISMGHTDDANGVWAYGYPSEELIMQAAKCR